MKYFLFTTAFLCIIFSACSSSKNTTSKKNNPTTKTICENIPMTSAEPVIGWQPATAPMQSEVGASRLPSKFDSYTIDEVKLNEYFTYAGKQKKNISFSLPLPKPLECQYFLLQDAGTMAPELAAKYPEIVSLKGNGTGNKAADIRVNYDGKQMKIQVIWDGLIYLVTPVQLNGKIIYLVYDKASTGDVKQPFEANPALQKNAPSGRPFQFKQER